MGAGLFESIDVRDLPVELSLEGALEEKQAVEKPAACDGQLIVHRPISSRQPAATACIVRPQWIGSRGSQYGGRRDLGFASERDKEESGVRSESLHASLVRVLSDSASRAELAPLNWLASERYFSWALAGKRHSARRSGGRIASPVEC
jgi:hypothetical protein